MHKILEIPDLFQLSVAKFMHSFCNGGLPNHFDNYFAEIASIHKYQTRLASLQKYYLPRMKTSLGQLSLKYIGPKIWSSIPEKLKSSSPYSFGKKYLKKVLLSCQTSCWSSFYILVTFCNIALMPLLSLLSTSIVAHPTPCRLHMHAFPHCFFVVVFMLISPDVDLTLFITTCKTSSIEICVSSSAGWELDPSGLSPTLRDSTC